MVNKKNTFHFHKRKVKARETFQTKAQEKPGEANKKRLQKIYNMLIIFVFCNRITVFNFVKIAKK